MFLKLTRVVRKVKSLNLFHETLNGVSTFLLNLDYIRKILHFHDTFSNWGKISKLNFFRFCSQSKNKKKKISLRIQNLSRISRESCIYGKFTEVNFDKVSYCRCGTELRYSKCTNRQKTNHQRLLMFVVYMICLSGFVDRAKEVLSTNHRTIKFSGHCPKLVGNLSTTRITIT